MVRKNPRLFYAVFFCGILILDQATKILARNLAESLPVIKNIFHLTFIMNFGVAFGLFQGFNDIIMWLYLVVLGLVIFFYDKFPKDRFSQIMLIFIIAGIAGNFLDRIIFGYVTDFIDFRVWPVFNLADVYLNVGIIGMIGKELLRKK
jgi:signal peptidase II